MMEVKGGKKQGSWRRKNLNAKNDINELKVSLKRSGLMKLVDVKK